jgi:SAM-dependent methyltransferase
MTLDDFYFLLSPAGQRLLRETADTPITPHNHLQIASQLRQQASASQAQAVLETTLLRQRAVAKFSRAADMYFTRPALEQASAEIISTYRARRFADAGLDSIADLGCGIGGDALALAAAAQVTGVDWDPVRLAMAQENVRVYGRGDRFQPLQADLLALRPLPVQAIFFDPARRDEHGRRFHSVHDYQPPLSLLERWQAQVRGTAVKISPAVDYAELPAAAEIEFISVRGEVREGVLWDGALHSGVARRAILLPGEQTLTSANLPPDAIPLAEPRAFLYEPDGAVIRARLVEAVAAQLGATKLDEEIAYLTADTAQATPFARCFRLEAYFPFQLKRLRHYLRARHIGQVTIKKRGSPLDPEALARQLRLEGDEHRHIFLTHVGGKAAVLIGQPVSEAAA